MATVSTRALWKGAISFGLVHIPIALHSAIEESRPRMHMLDQGTGARVGYKKVDKSTGEEISNEEIVKGMEVDKGQYVTLTREEIKEALPRTTQTIDIESFVKKEDVPTVYFNKPYYSSPAGKGNKPYALLRDVLRRTGRVGVGRIVISTKQHLALVVPHGDGLVINLLRWADEVRDTVGLPLPGTAEENGVSEREMKMGEQLVLDLADEWHPERFRDEFREKIEALVEAKRQAGDIRHVAAELDAAESAAPSADVIDLTELLRKSLRAKTSPAEAAQQQPAPARKSATTKPPAKTPAKTAARRAANDEAGAQRAVAASKATKSRTTVKPARPKSA